MMGLAQKSADGFRIPVILGISGIGTYKIRAFYLELISRIRNLGLAFRILYWSDNPRNVKYLVLWIPVISDFNITGCAYKVTIFLNLRP